MALGHARWPTRLAASAAVLSLGAFLLLWIVRVRYENRLRQQIWPDKLTKPSIVATSPSESLPTVMLIGDSRMAQWGLPELAHCRVVNAGTPGYTTAQTRSCLPLLLDQFHPKIVVLQAGINDLKFLGLRPGMRSEIVSLALSNIVAMADECAGHHCKVLLLEIWPASQPSLARRLVWNQTISTATVQLNEELRSLDSDRNGIHVVNLFDDAKLNPRNEFYRDTLHFKQSAYELITPVLKRDLDKF